MNIGTVLVWGGILLLLFLLPYWEHIVRSCFNIESWSLRRKDTMSKHNIMKNKSRIYREVLEQFIMSLWWYIRHIFSRGNYHNYLIIKIIRRVLMRIRISIMIILRKEIFDDICHPGLIIKMIRILLISRELKSIIMRIMRIRFDPHVGSGSKLSDPSRVLLVRWTAIGTAINCRHTPLQLLLHVAKTTWAYALEPNKFP